MPRRSNPNFHADVVVEQVEVTVPLEVVKAAAAFATEEVEFDLLATKLNYIATMHRRRNSQRVRSTNRSGMNEALRQLKACALAAQSGAPTDQYQLLGSIQGLDPGAYNRLERQLHELLAPKDRENLTATLHDAPQELATEIAKAAERAINTRPGPNTQIERRVTFGLLLELYVEISDGPITHTRAVGDNGGSVAASKVGQFLTVVWKSVLPDVPLTAIDTLLNEWIRGRGCASKP